MPYAEVMYNDDLLEVEFSYYPGHPGHRPTMNDPGEPPTPPEFEIRNIAGGDRALSEYYDGELDVIEELIMQQIRDDF